MGVRPSWQGGGLGKQLYHEMERRMHEEGVRMAFVDTARSNTGAIKFFKRMGYGKPEAEVWMRKMLQRTRKVKNNQDSIGIALVIEATPRSACLPGGRNLRIAFAQRFNYVIVRHLIEVIEELPHGGKVCGHIQTHHGVALVQHCPRCVRRCHGDSANKCLWIF